MIDINDNDFKLLKMNESLLSKIKDKDLIYKTIKDYSLLAKRIDEKNYQEFISKIEDKKHSQTLEEELSYLEELENEYTQLEELQCKFRNIYSMYCDDELSLSDLSVIQIDKIRERKNLISGYLVNVKNIDTTKGELEKFNEQLIFEDKKRTNNRERYLRLEEELKNAFINAEGRKETVSAYTSVKNEYEENGFDIQRLVNDKEYLNSKLVEVQNIRKEKEELLKTGKICYENMPSKENKEVLNSLNVDAIVARYQLSLLKIVNLIANYQDNYDKLLEKREQLLDLIKKRVSYLGTLGKKFVVDPFSRIKIQEQVGYIETSLEDNTRMISRIRKSINESSNKLEELMNKNSEYLMMIPQEDNNYIVDKLSFSDVDVSSVDDNTLVGDWTNIVDSVYDNQVISIKDIPNSFKKDIVSEKTRGVITRVYEMVVEESVLDVKPLEDKDDEYNTTNNNDSNSDEEENSLLEIQEVNIPNDDSTLEESPLDHDEEVSESNWQDNGFLIDDITSSIKSTDVKKKKMDDDNLFMDNVSSPFNEIELFGDKVSDAMTVEQGNSDVLTNETIKELKDKRDKINELRFDNDLSLEKNQEISEIVDSGRDSEFNLPEAFWEVKDNNQEKDVESIDEQVKKLKLVA